jgi:hypothetical protein
MLIIGDDLVPYEEISFIISLDEISKSKANSTILFKYNENILKYCNQNNLSFGVIVNSLKESIYTNSLNAKYIISEKSLSTTIQNIAENYMFDSKVLSIIESSDEIEKVAMDKIDGVIYKKLIG